MKYIENTLKEAGSEILKGNADIAPYKLKDETACKYCPYIAICRFDKYISGYNYREINQLNDEEIIEKLKQKRRNSMPWSAQQQQAINTYDKNILVAAAAGSGKTSVLVERVIQRIVNKTCDINQILVVTFTNAAASEMRERIASAITEKLSDKDKERQLVLLNASSIVHTSCFLSKYHSPIFPSIRLRS